MPTVNKCNKCGMCCSAIMIVIPQNMYEEALKNLATKDAEFIREHWKHLTYEEVCTINPMFIDEKFKIKYDERGVMFFSCDQIDQDTKLCKSYETRPYVCSGYPFYDFERPYREDYEGMIWYTPSCGWKEYCDNKPSTYASSYKPLDKESEEK